MITDEEEGVASASEEERWWRAVECLSDHAAGPDHQDRTIRTGLSGSSGFRWMIGPSVLVSRR